MFRCPGHKSTKIKKIQYDYKTQTQKLHIEHEWHVANFSTYEPGAPKKRPKKSKVPFEKLI